MNIIRKIVVGVNPKDAMTYVVGNSAGVGKVVLIEEDERAFLLYNLRRYNVYVEGESGSFIWKSIENIPCVVEYDCDFD
jgi:hypothetical protein